MRRHLLIFAALLGAAVAHADEWTVRRPVATDFAETRDAIVGAIENRGLVVNYVSHIGDMLQRTGADLGATRQVYGQAEIVEFCSAALSRRMMEADPHAIVLCPFAIAIYTLPGETQTWVSYRRPQGGAAAIVGPLLGEIVAEAGH